MTFDPIRALATERAELERRAQDPMWRDYVIDKAERMAREEHGMWAPLAEVAAALKQSTPRAGRAFTPRRSA